jgi:hypothetical protein
MPPCVLGLAACAPPARDAPSPSPDGSGDAAVRARPGGLRATGEGRSITLA